MSKGYALGDQRLINVHDERLCSGRACVIHAPSDHHMAEWHLHWRNDKGQMERLCPDHGVGHPDPDDLSYHESQDRGWMAVHGCCGCCQ